MPNFMPTLSRFQAAKVLVAGDVMLDRYWFGDVSRISPEAPVPVAKIEETEHRAGGAANVARNIATLGGQVALLSVVGEDDAANTLSNLLAQDNIADHLIRSEFADTTLKLRVLARNQQLIRLDFEKTPDLGSLKVANAAESLAMMNAVLRGEAQGAARDIVLLNAAACLYAGNVATDLADGLARAKEALDSGKAAAKQAEFVAQSQAK